jgi:AcrR family transcriptional regulator
MMLVDTTSQRASDGSRSEASPLEASRRDRKKRATRRAIRNAALDLVAARGFAHVTIEEIAQAADVAPRTFFNYFPSKESALIGSDPERITAICERLLARPRNESSFAALRAVLIENSREIAEECDEAGGGGSTWYRRFCIVRSDPDLLRAYVGHVCDVEDQIAAAVRARLGDAATEPYPALLTATMLAAVRISGLHWSASGGTNSLPALTTAAIDTLAAGLVDDAQITKALAEPPDIETGQDTYGLHATSEPRR